MKQGRRERQIVRCFIELSTSQVARAGYPETFGGCLTECACELPSQEIQSRTHLSIGFHSLLTKTAPQALLISPALLGCICVTAERVLRDVPYSSVREAGERYKVLPDAPTR